MGLYTHIHIHFFFCQLRGPRIYGSSNEDIYFPDFGFLLKNLFFIDI